MKHPFSVPTHLPPNLVRVVAYWKGLLRGNATMPFWDDVRLIDLPDLADRLLLIDVFDLPERFRFNTVGKTLNDEAMAGRFIDELDLGWPFEILPAQCSVTVESATPTFFHQAGSDGFGSARPYFRLLLPLWGEGRIGMLLGAVDLE